MNMRYAVIYETDDSGGYSAYAPDFPGCGATGESLDEVRQLIQEAISFHIEGLKLHGLPVPPPSTQCEYLDVA
jgi:predicted RNase H-like HicB family nuclease